MLEIPNDIDWIYVRHYAKNKDKIQFDSESLKIIRESIEKISDYMTRLDDMVTKEYINELINQLD